MNTGTMKKDTSPFNIHSAHGVWAPLPERKTRWKRSFCFEGYSYNRRARAREADKTRRTDGRTTDDDAFNENHARTHARTHAPKGALNVATVRLGS